MIEINKAKSYCSEDISLIENYELAIGGQTQTWECHHRKETDEGLSRTELIEMGLYFNRPASELIFLTKSEHSSLHHKNNKHNLGNHHTEETKTKMSEAKNGEKHPLARTVYQIHKVTGIIIREWKCISVAARTLNINRNCINGCCQGKRKSAGGFIWKYADDLEKVV